MKTQSTMSTGARAKGSRDIKRSFLTFRGKISASSISRLTVPVTRFWSLACFSIAILIVIFRGPIATHEHTIPDLLAMRFSIANLLAGGACLLLWNFLLGTIRSRPQEQGALWPILTLALQVTSCTGLAGFLLMLRHRQLATFSALVSFATISVALLICARIVASCYHHLVRPAIRRERNVVIVGSGWRGQMLASELARHSQWNYGLIGFVDSGPPEPVSNLLGGIDCLEAILVANAIDEVIITLPVKSRYDDIQESISICERVGVQSRFSTDLFATQVTKRRSFDHDDPSSVLLHMVHNETGRTLKRAVDVFVSITCLVCLSPVLLAVALCIRLTSDGPILFRQERYGLNRHLFSMYKFRSMVFDAEKKQGELEHLNEKSGAVFKIKQDPRITSVGRFIRKTSIDEIPQLWNVLRGEMSLVGPRPLPVRDVSRFSEAWLMRRFSVPPGITGLWQVSGRSDTSFNHLIELDLTYIDQWSLLLDLKIVAMTFPAVFKGSGAA